MVVDGAIFVVSLLALLYSADRLIDGVVALAQRFNVSPMVIGLTVVAVGTSLPEVMASVAAALEGHPQIAVGNVVGSNICNVGLILGLPGLFYIISCRAAVLKREGMIMLAATAAAWLLFDTVGGMGRLSGVLFLAGFAAFIVTAMKGEGAIDPIAEAEEAKHEKPPPAQRILLLMAAALAVLLVSSKFLVTSTIALAADLGVPEQIIAISLVAFGTSVPELSVSCIAARRKQGDILVGNILGSNVSNILLVLGLTAVLNPFTTTQVLGRIELPLMALLAVLMIYFLSQKSGISPAKAGILLLLYVSFIAGCAAGLV